MQEEYCKLKSLKQNKKSPSHIFKTRNQENVRNSLGTRNTNK